MKKAMKEEIERILMNNFTRGDIKTATQQLDELFKEKYTQEWLVSNINKQSLGGIDLKQYVTNLLYAAYDKGVQRLEISLFDSWLEKIIKLIDRYYLDANGNKNTLKSFLIWLEKEGGNSFIDKDILIDCYLRGIKNKK
jgi:hypothetical protein